MVGVGGANKNRKSTSLGLNTLYMTLTIEELYPEEIMQNVRNVNICNLKIKTFETEKSAILASTYQQ